MSNNPVGKTPVVAIYYNRQPDSTGYLNKVRQFREFLPELSIAFEKRGIKFVLLCKEKSYIGHGLFSNYWHIDKDGGQLVKVNEPVMPDIVYDKGHFNNNDGFIKLINHCELSKLGRNKYTQSRLFPSLMPKVVLFLPGSGSKKKDILKQLSTPIIIVKPLHGSGGRGIEALNAVQIVKKTFSEPMLFQEFVETKQGIPGLTGGRHDLRLYVLDGEAKLASVRTPKKDSYLANTSLGGTIGFLAAADVPDGPLSIMKVIDKYMEHFGARFYSVDVLFDGNRWWFIELNDRPGIPALYQSEHITGFHEAFVQLFERELQGNDSSS